jgi:glycogen(starch) synthase
MRILFWSLSFWPNIGGIEVLAAKLLPALRERGHEFMVVVPKSDPDLLEEGQYQGIPIRRLSIQNNVDPNGIDHLIGIRKKVVELKREFAPDLVHINGVGHSSFFHLTTSQIDRAPLLVTLHGQWESQADAIVGHTLRAAAWVAGCSAAILERGRLLVPEIADRSSIIYNGLEAPQLRPEPLPFGDPRILCLGRLSSEKGMDLALGAFPPVLERFPRARLIIAGNGLLRSELKWQAARQGVAHAVDFVGWVAPDEVPSLINSSTIVLMPSRHDSLPLVALEAAWMARPIVATRVGGLPEIVVHKATGLLVEKENIDALAESVMILLADHDTAQRMGQAARERAQKLFSWERHVDAYDALYRRVA